MSILYFFQMQVALQFVYHSENERDKVYDSINVSHILNDIFV